MALTIDELRAIADALRKAAEEIDAYLDDNYQKITRPEYEFLNETFKELIYASSVFTTKAVGLVIEDLKNPAADIKNVIDKAKEEIKKLKLVGDVIKFVAGLADLAAGIMSRDPKAIVTAISNLLNQITQKKQN